MGSRSRFLLDVSFYAGDFFTLLGSRIRNVGTKHWISSENIYRDWKGILRIQDLTKIWWGIRENEKYLDGIQDLTATMEVGLTKIWDILGKRNSG